MSPWTKSELRHWAAQAGLLVREYSPGDGVTRYKFFRAGDCPRDQTYFGPKNGLRTVLGLERACIYVSGYLDGVERVA